MSGTVLVRNEGETCRTIYEGIINPSIDLGVVFAAKSSLSETFHLGDTAIQGRLRRITRRARQHALQLAEVGQSAEAAQVISRANLVRKPPRLRKY